MTLLAQQKDQPRKDEAEHRGPKHYQQLPPPTPEPTTPEPPSGPHGAEATVGELVAQLSEQVSRLVRDELALAELEAKRRTRRAGISAGALGFGGGLAFFGACCFATAAVLALAMVMRPWAAALCVGAAFVIASGIFGTPGLVGMRGAGKGAGKQSVESVKADVAALRQAVHGREAVRR
jgi:hypothetical protein